MAGGVIYFHSALPFLPSGMPAARFMEGKVNRKLYFAVAAFLSVLLSLSAYGQRLDGTLRGTVRDPSGAVIPGADVTVTNETTGGKQTTQSTSTGEYVFPNLQVGTYTVEVIAKGFGDFSRKGVDVLPNQVISADASLRERA